MVEKIYTKSAAYQRLETLRDNRNKRYKYGEFLAEGVRNINEAIKNGWEIRSFVYTRERPLSDWARGVIEGTQTAVNYELTGELMDDLSGKSDASELIMIAAMRADDLDVGDFSDNPVIALFDRPSNKGNLGTIIRSCDALGVECLILTGHSVDMYDPDVITASMGSFFNLRVVRMPENKAVFGFIDAMKKRWPMFKAIGTTAHRENAIFDVDMTTPVMFMIGNETDGLCAAFKECCDVLCTIPMALSSYASSFNVGCAATVMFYEASRQRNQYLGLEYTV